MLAKAVGDHPRRRRLALRAEVGRFPVHRGARRRRARAHQPQRPAASPATSPSCSARCGTSSPTGASSTARSSSPARPGLDFDALLQRIHPAESRVSRLAAETPASFVAFDLLALDGDVAARRTARRNAGPNSSGSSPYVRAADPPDAGLDRSPADARSWFGRFEGAGLDGIVAKRLDGPYTPGLRTMVKVKHERTADCAVAGYRIHKDGKGVGSLLLGLYDDEGTMHHVGVAASFTVKRRAELLRGTRADDPRRARRPPVAELGRGDGPRTGPAARAPRAAGTPARTSRGCRSGSNGSPR